MIAVHHKAGCYVLGTDLRRVSGFRNRFVEHLEIQLYFVMSTSPVKAEEVELVGYPTEGQSTFTSQLNHSISRSMTVIRTHSPTENRGPT